MQSETTQSQGLLFTPAKIGSLTLPNRLIRSATHEYRADEDGRPLPSLAEMYAQLARGGVGLIVSGHMFVHPTGKTHLQMSGIYSDDLIPALAQLTAAVHREGGLIAAQLNHGGAAALKDGMLPSVFDMPFPVRPGRQLTDEDIHMLIDAFAQAARRAKAAGFDAIQVHAAHGYLISQFLSPYLNRRTDNWGGSPERRLNFLRAVCKAVRQQVGNEYPVFTKLATVDNVAGGLTPEASMEYIAALEDMHLDALEISSGFGGDRSDFAIRKGVVKLKTEAYFRPTAQQARCHTRLPIALVGGIRSRLVMEDILASGDADFISLCRPLIHEPHLPNRLKNGLQDASTCLSANLCSPQHAGEDTTCRCPFPTEKT